MKVDFRIDLGYQLPYSRKQYHPVFIWDGSLSVDKGEILKTYKIEYPYMWFGNAKSPKYVELDGPKWKLNTKRSIEGLRFIAEVEEDAVFTFKTVSCEFTFTAKDIIEKGKIEHDVGPKNLRCVADITRTGYYWYMPTAKKGQTILYSKDIPLQNLNWARMELALLEPNKEVSFTYVVKEKSKDYMETCLHLVAMALPFPIPDSEIPVSARIPFEVYCDGQLVASFFHHYRFHDEISQLMEDTWVNLNLTSGTHVLTLKNKHSSIAVGLNRLILSENEYDHTELVVSPWAIENQGEKGKVFALCDDKIKVKVGKQVIFVDAKTGWTEFDYMPIGKKSIKISTKASKCEVEILPKIQNPAKVGFDLTCAPHDDSLWMERLLDYTYYTKLGNYVVFRNFLEKPEEPVSENSSDDLYKSWANHLSGANNLTELSSVIPANDYLMEKWGKICLDHKIWACACTDFLSGALIKGAGEYFHNCGRHEFTGAVYAFDPTEPWSTTNMKDASLNYIKYLKLEIDKAKGITPRFAFGDGTGGTRYSYLAGVNYVRVETMVSHTQHIISQARPASEALGDGKWATHIAIQHIYFFNKPIQLNQFFLCLMQPWAMGAEAIYEEDSLWCIFKEERVCWDDFLSKRKRDMLRNFYKFTHTIDRKGKNVRNIAFLEGRYAAPFNGFICGAEQDPNYSVWGLFGKKNDATWGHRQPEKCRQLLDVLMPDASTLPLRQKMERYNQFFSGTPYGDFDAVPMEAKGDYLYNYKLIMNLGWNTMLSEDYDKLYSYVENGGVLLTGIPQFSTHVERGFLADMEDLKLYNDGDISSLTGIKVIKKGDLYSGQYNCRDRDKIVSPSLSAVCSDNVYEDGLPYLADVELKGAEIVAWDAQSGKPMLVRYALGKGFVYTFTIWAYPGHELFMQFSADWIAKLCKEARGNTYIEDQSKKVFYTTWVDGDTTQIMALNTDYMNVNNVIDCALVIDGKKTPCKIKEGVISIFTIKNGKFTLSEHTIY